MTDVETVSPKTFISYAWGKTEHNEWVLQLATELAENFGVDVIFDRWDLRENDDKYVFMEQSVTNSDVRKVVMICDQNYQKKADERSGGVGTETQIISGEVYAKVKSAEDQKHKFCAIIKERDENGKECIPTYLKSRIYIDMSTDELRDQNLEQLVFWIFDKPLIKKPKLGKTPAYIFADEKTTLRTSSLFRLAVNAISQNKSNALGVVRDYLDTLSSNLEELRITPSPETNFDDQVIESIESFLPYRNEFLDLISNIIRYSQNTDFILEISMFFERVLPYLFVSATDNSGFQRDYYKYENDNFRFIIRELFLLTNALLIKNQKFVWVNELLTKDYYLEKQISDYNSQKIHAYIVINQPLYSFENRARRLNLQTNLVATLAKERMNRDDLKLTDMMQADFILYLRDELSGLRGGQWYPFSLYFQPYEAFELFVRAESIRFFENFKMILGIKNKKELGVFLDKYDSGAVDRIAMGYFDRLNLRNLSNFERLAIKN